MEFKRPDWSYWLIQDAWTLREAIWLSLDHDPDQHRGGTLILGESLTNDFQLRESTAIRSHIDGKLPTIKDTALNSTLKPEKIKAGHPYKGPQTEIINVDNYQYLNIRPHDFTIWLINKNFKVPDEMADLLNAKVTQLDFGRKNKITTARRITAWFLKTQAHLTTREIAKIIYPKKNYEKSGKRSTNRDIEDGAKTLNIPFAEADLTGD